MTRNYKERGTTVKNQETSAPMTTGPRLPDARLAAALPATAVKASSTLQFDINGPWTDNGSAKPVITNVSSVLVIDMSYADRPNATGSVIDASSSILVTFPDDNTYIGTFVTPTLLAWSNGSTWRKVYRDPMLFVLRDDWTDGRTNHLIRDANGFITVGMSSVRRPDAPAFAVDPGTFVVSFPDDPNTTSATLHPALTPAGADVITWSNGSQWQRAPAPPGNPGC
jgi:hypothetical protein